ncbi:hypothetical protein EDEG_00396 [Edhazardia aedis USNM 41457]|uniref:Uncharacterized protein n=1 Tax=Edhazardia aedis (strain USNM 41457) TaxID=1003232 RepID=J9D275_EDHAE|nr:hypothetical protein EDEG_00396 [Edhazardia aedis USNM 41457]|eukprot:EJW01679.1 hypothetical protein EDEG_00396 [Edhazardia aedis USNM 41457]
MKYPTMGKKLNSKAIIGIREENDKTKQLNKSDRDVRYIEKEGRLSMKQLIFKIFCNILIIFAYLVKKSIFLTFLYIILDFEDQIAKKNGFKQERYIQYNV